MPVKTTDCQKAVGLVAVGVSSNHEHEEPGALSQALDGKVLAGQCRELVHGLGLHGLSARLKVGWNPRLRSTAGRAWLKDSWIELNPLLAGHGTEEVRLTLLHELAHLVAHERHGRRIAPHGPEWRLACAELGIPGAPVTHRLELPRRKVRRRYYYECPSCGSGMKRVQKMTRQAACLDCCRRHAAGRFDKRFVMVERKL